MALTLTGASDCLTYRRTSPRIAFLVLMGIAFSNIALLCRRFQSTDEAKDLEPEAPNFITAYYGYTRQLVHRIISTRSLHIKVSELSAIRKLTSSKHLGLLP